MLPLALPNIILYSKPLDFSYFPPVYCSRLLKTWPVEMWSPSESVLSLAPSFMSAYSLHFLSSHDVLSLSVHTHNLSLLPPILISIMSDINNLSPLLPFLLLPSDKYKCISSYDVCILLNLLFISKLLRLHNPVPRSLFYESSHTCSKLLRWFITLAGFFFFFYWFQVCLMSLQWGESDLFTT